MAHYNTAFYPAASGRGIKKCNKMNHRDIITNIMENCQFKSGSKLENMGDNLEKDLVTLRCDKKKISISFKAREAVLAPKFIRETLKKMFVLSQGL